MQVITSIRELKLIISNIRRKGKTIGFVPTMGALHKGHISLLDKCLKDKNFSIASIYVNPSQFNDKNDLRNYPRDLEKDCKLLEQANCDLIFTPTDEEMYPEKDVRVFDFGTMGSVMEGKHRPGHFNGVAQIVTKLFDAVEPDKAYFGKKDFQQLAIIRKFSRDTNYSIDIIGCPIIREADGLAMSSRNQLLNKDQRKAAPLIYNTLRQAKSLIHSQSIPEIENYVEKTINNNPFLKLEYFQYVESDSLHQIRQFTPEVPVNACIAVFAGKLRLIDNIEIIL